MPHPGEEIQGRVELTSLPPETLAHILSFLSPLHLHSARQACKLIDAISLSSGLRYMAALSTRGLKDKTRFMDVPNQSSASANPGSQPNLAIPKLQALENLGRRWSFISPVGLQQIAYGPVGYTDQFTRLLHVQDIDRVAFDGGVVVLRENGSTALKWADLSMISNPRTVKEFEKLSETDERFKGQEVEEVDLNWQEIQLGRSPSLVKLFLEEHDLVVVVFTEESFPNRITQVLNSNFTFEIGFFELSTGKPHSLLSPSTTNTSPISISTHPYPTLHYKLSLQVIKSSLIVLLEYNRPFQDAQGNEPPPFSDVLPQNKLYVYHWPTGRLEGSVALTAPHAGLAVDGFGQKLTGLAVLNAELFIVGLTEIYDTNAAGKGWLDVYELPSRDDYKKEGSAATEDRMALELDPVFRFELPKLNAKADGLRTRYLEILCNDNPPVVSNSKTCSAPFQRMGHRSGPKYVSDSDMSILSFQAFTHAFNDLQIIIHRSSLLDLYHRYSKSAPSSLPSGPFPSSPKPSIPWSLWGRPYARLLTYPGGRGNARSFVHGQRVLTTFARGITTCGLDFAIPTESRPIHRDITMLDFNPYNVKKMGRLLERMDSDDILYANSAIDESEEQAKARTSKAELIHRTWIANEPENSEQFWVCRAFGPEELTTGLPYVGMVSRFDPSLREGNMGIKWDRCVFDEERVLNVRIDPITKNRFILEMWNFV